MRILVTTGIFEPESGGPATLTPKIASRLIEKGWDVTVITYSDKPYFDQDAKYPFRLVRVVRKGNRLLNYGAYLFAVLKHIRGRQLVYSLDWLAAGLPVTVAAFIFRKPVVIRVGGDYIWERYLETDREPMPLIDFYARNLQKDYGLLFALIRFVLRRADHVVFNTDVQREMYHRRYSLSPSSTSAIYNPVPKAGWEGIARGEPHNEIVFAGRFVAMKNAAALVRAFSKAKLPPDYRLILIGDGPEKEKVGKLVKELSLEARVEMMPGMSQKALYERVKDCRAIVLPSWTDISPNQVFEAMQLKIPMLVTKENYLSIRDALPETIDPRSSDDIARKLEMLARDDAYRDFVKKWDSLSFDYDWDREMKEHYAVFERVSRRGSASLK